MNSVLAELLDTSKVKTASGSGSVDVHSSISASEGQFLQELIRQVDPTITLEVGLAYGVSALFICEALKVRKGTQHIAIDPNQHGGPWGFNWDGIGIANLQRAGFGNIVRLIESPSYRALSELESSGQRIDFAFIDGWHTFDFSLVDFFFIDRMLNVGGIVAFDDADWPAVRKVCRFARTNLSYSLMNVGGLSGVRRPSLKRRLGTLLPRRGPFRKLLPPHMLMRSEDVKLDLEMGMAGSCIAFRKEANDGRRFDHFVDF
jgi:predicted O-methyltransferase YrrM